MLGKRLRILRSKYCLQQKDLADILNVSTSTIGMYEREQRDPDTSTLKLLAKHFNVSVDWLLGLTDIPNIYQSLGLFEKYDLDFSNLSERDVQYIKEYTDFVKYKYERRTE